MIAKTSPTLRPFNPAYAGHAIQIWNAAGHPDYPLGERLLGYNLTPGTGEVIEGRIAMDQRGALGFVLVSAVVNNPTNTLGWISAIAVHPSAQMQGIGSALLEWAEGWLQEKGCKRVRLGGNLRPFVPGLPVVMRENALFFEKHGYQSLAGQPYEYDIARSLKDYQPVYSKPSHASLIPMKPGEESFLLDFLHAEYPGRWEFEASEFVKNGGRASDYLLLRVHGEVKGFCRLTLADSERPIERFYPQRLPEPWGQFGPLGVAREVRGQGLGGYLIDAAAVYLQSLSVDGCVIDWTSLVELYGKFGFRVYNQYISLFRSLQKP